MTKLRQTTVALTLAVCLLGQTAPIVDNDRAFLAKYVPFGSDTIIPVDKGRITHGREAHDITSCLYTSRKGIVELLGRARVPATFDDSRIRLYVRAGREEWMVDQPGVVLYSKKSFALSDADYRALLTLLLVRLPQNGPALLDSAKERRYKNESVSKHAAGGPDRG